MWDESTVDWLLGKSHNAYECMNLNIYIIALYILPDILVQRADVR